VKNLGAGDRTHNQPEVAAAATHHHSPPVSHEGGGRASTEWKKERVESGNPYIKAGEIAAISLRARRPERERGRARRSFPFPPEPARATPPSPKIAYVRRHELGSKETRVLVVSRGPGGEGVFGSRKPGSLAGHDHKHGNLQPTGTAGPPSQGRKRALNKSSIQINR